VDVVGLLRVARFEGVVNDLLEPVEGGGVGGIPAFAHEPGGGDASSITTERFGQRSLHGGACRLVALACGLLVEAGEEAVADSRVNRVECRGSRLEWRRRGRGRRGGVEEAHGGEEVELAVEVVAGEGGEGGAGDGLLALAGEDGGEGVGGDAEAEEADALEEGERRGVALAEALGIALGDAREAELLAEDATPSGIQLAVCCLAKLVGGAELERGGGVAAAELGDVAAGHVDGERVAAALADDALQLHAAAPHAALVEQADARVHRQVGDLDGGVAGRPLLLEAGDGEAGGDDDADAAEIAAGEVADQVAEPAVEDLAEDAACPALLHFLQAVEDEQDAALALADALFEQMAGLLVGGRRLRVVVCLVLEPGGEVAEEGVGVGAVVEGEDEAGRGRGQVVALGDAGEVGQGVGQDAEEAIDDGRLARAADADERAHPVAARLPPRAQTVELRAVLPVARGQETVNEMDPGHGRIPPHRCPRRTTRSKTMIPNGGRQGKRLAVVLLRRFAMALRGGRQHNRGRRRGRLGPMAKKAPQDVGKGPLWGLPIADWRLCGKEGAKKARGRPRERSPVGGVRGRRREGAGPRRKASGADPADGGKMEWGRRKCGVSPSLWHSRR